MTSLCKDGTVLSLPQSGGGAPEDALRAMLQHLIHQTLEPEFRQFLGAARFERSPERRGVRNGHRRRRLLTRVGALELRVPRDRAGQFQPTLFARYQRSEQALVLALVEMYLQGISTRKVSAVVEPLCGTTISASAISALAKTLGAALAAWRTRIVRVFPNEASFLRLASALAAERNEQWLSRRYVGATPQTRAAEEAADTA